MPPDQAAAAPGDRRMLALPSTPSRLHDSLLADNDWLTVSESYTVACSWISEGARGGVNPAARKNIAAIHAVGGANSGNSALRRAATTLIPLPEWTLLTEIWRRPRRRPRDNGLATRAWSAVIAAKVKLDSAAPSPMLRDRVRQVHRRRLPYQPYGLRWACPPYRHTLPTSNSSKHTDSSSGTVGATAASRVSTKPLPESEAGKPYPPPLPAQEEFVVEFMGPDDPLHPQNWPTKKKCASLAPSIGLADSILEF